MGVVVAAKAKMAERAGTGRRRLRSGPPRRAASGRAGREREGAARAEPPRSDCFAGALGAGPVYQKKRIAVLADSNKSPHIQNRVNLGQLMKQLVLLIGNSTYPEEALENATNDAVALAQKVSELGFICKVTTDATVKTMDVVVAEYGEQPRPAHVPGAQRRR